MLDQFVDMPKNLEKDISKQAKKRGITTVYKTELSFVLKNQWWIISNWGIIVTFLPDNPNPRGFKNMRFGRLGDKPLFASSPWEDFEINFHKDNKISFKEIKKTPNFNSHFHISKLSEKDFENKKQYVEFPNEGMLELLKVIYKNYKK